MSVYINPIGQVVQSIPIVELDKDSSIILTDNIGRQTIVSLAQQQPTYTLSQPAYIIPSYLNTLPPLISSTYEYQDINEDSELHQKVMKKVYTNFYNYIIPTQFPYLLNYVKKNKGSFSMVKSKKEYNRNKTNESEYESKLQYLSKNVYSKSDMYGDIKKYLETYDIKWYDIDDNKKDVFEMLVNKLKSKLSNLVK
jgi:hypothetical protein